MSRSALNHSWAAKARAGKLLADPFDVLNGYEASEEQCRAAAPVARDFSPRTMSMETLLATNIVTASSFEKDVLPLASVEDVVAEVCRRIESVEPLCVDEPSEDWPAAPAPRHAAARALKPRRSCWRGVPSASTLNVDANHTSRSPSPKRP